jgi:hypothetical protein
MVNSNAAEHDLERFREYRRMARDAPDAKTRVELRAIARGYLRRAAQADPVFVARASAEAAASLLAKIVEKPHPGVNSSTRSGRGRVIRPAIAAWKSRA